MKVPLVAVVIFSVLAELASAETFPVEDGVLVLSPSNFNAALARFPNLMVEFYAPWCGHCQALAPKYTKAARQLETSGSQVKLAKLDAVRYAAFAEQHGVTGYPTLMFYRGGAPVEYGGAHEQVPLVQWVLRNARFSRQVDPVVQLTADNFEATVMKNPFVMVEFYAPWCPHCQEFAPRFSKAAAELLVKDPRVILAKVDATIEEQLADLHGVKRYPTLKFFRYGVPEIYQGTRNQQSIVQWILANTESTPVTPNVRKSTEVPTKLFNPKATINSSPISIQDPSGDLRAEDASTDSNSSEKTIPVIFNLLLLIAVSLVLS